MLKKQTIDLCEQWIDEKTIKTLKRGDRYRLYKFSFRLRNKKECQVKMVYRMIDEMPDLDINKIEIVGRI